MEYSYFHDKIEGIRTNILSAVTPINPDSASAPFFRKKSLADAGRRLTHNRGKLGEFPGANVK
jgi:hypothetical protein